MLTYIRSIKNPAIAKENVIKIKVTTIFGSEFSTPITVCGSNLTLNIIIKLIAIRTITRRAYEKSLNTFQIFIKGFKLANPIPSAA